MKKSILLLLFFCQIKAFSQFVQLEKDKVLTPKIGIGTSNPLRPLHLNGGALFTSEEPLDNFMIGTTESMDAKLVVYSRNFGNGVIIDALSTPGGYGLLVKGSAHIAGNLSKAGGTFKIDHPQDPLNKYLSHSFVESPEMINIYSGNITTDSDGVAKVSLPSYFEALNTDFRYQLTVIGEFAQAIVSKKIKENTFEIKTSTPNTEVSWQVTGTRKDEWALQNPIKVEEEKPMAEKGKLLNN
ncbi:MAG TPA: hypothetical protein VK175_04785 [Leadbetterella sp.]|nr:hypothetical protein [Leadbetterella sp.]